MSEYRDYHSGMNTAVGQSVGGVQVLVDGVWLSVIPVSVAACRLHYSEAHVRLLCDTGQLIAIKLFNRWWLSVVGVANYAEAIRHRSSA